MSGFCRVPRLAATVSFAVLSRGCDLVEPPVAVGEGIENIILLSVHTVGRDALSSGYVP